MKGHGAPIRFRCSPELRRNASSSILDADLQPMATLPFLHVQGKSGEPLDALILGIVDRLASGLLSKPLHDHLVEIRALLGKMFVLEVHDSQRGEHQRVGAKSSVGDGYGFEESLTVGVTRCLVLL